MFKISLGTRQIQGRLGSWICLFIALNASMAGYPWFGIRHKHLRTKYLEAKTIYARNKTTDNKMRLSKSYKKSIFKWEIKWDGYCQTILKPFINYLIGNKVNLDNNVNVPPIDIFFNCFSDLNKGEPSNDNVFDFNMDEVLYEVNNPSSLLLINKSVQMK